MVVLYLRLEMLTNSYAQHYMTVGSEHAIYMQPQAIYEVHKGVTES